MKYYFTNQNLYIVKYYFISKDSCTAALSCICSFTIKKYSISILWYHHILSKAKLMYTHSKHKHSYTVQPWAFLRLVMLRAKLTHFCHFSFWVNEVYWVNDVISTRSLPLYQAITSKRVSVIEIRVYNSGNLVKLPCWMQISDDIQHMPAD